MDKKRDLNYWYTKLCWLKKVLLELNETEYIYFGIETEHLYLTTN
ncbi:11189_t:CDS:1, partial [Racocetra fulgida]